MATELELLQAKLIVLKQRLTDLELAYMEKYDENTKEEEKDNQYWFLVGKATNCVEMLEYVKEIFGDIKPNSEKDMENMLCDSILNMGIKDVDGVHDYIKTMIPVLIESLNKKRIILARV